MNNDLFTPEYADKVMATLRKFGDTSLNKISDVLPGGLPVDAIKSPSIGIPEEYRWNPIKGGSSSRTCSPIERLLEPYTLEAFPCPHCEKKNLCLIQQEGIMGEPEYWVGCGSSGWDCKSGICHDCGEVIADFKTWYAAWIMLDRPKDRLEEDLVNEFGQPEDD